MEPLATDTKYPNTRISLTRRPRSLPGDFAGTSAAIGDAREHEKKVGQAIEVNDDEGRKLGRLGEGYHPPLGAPAHGARDVQRGGFRCAAGNDEGAQRLELFLALVDRALELRDTIVVDPRLRELLVHLRV